MAKVILSRNQAKTHKQGNKKQKNKSEKQVSLWLRRFSLVMFLAMFDSSKLDVARGN